MKKRMRDLFIKLFSIKGLVLLLATIALYLNKIDGWIWLLTASIVIGGRTLEKIKGIGKNEC